MTIVKGLKARDYTEEAEGVVRELEARTQEVCRDVERWSGWQAVLEMPDDPDRFRAILREIMLQVHFYQKHTTEAGFHMLGRLPKSEVRQLQVLCNHKAEEAPHGLWAWEDYIALGGDPDNRDALPSPAAFAVASVWWHIARTEDPWGYLGAEFLFEYLTAELTRPIVDLIRGSDTEVPGYRFIVEHAYEDVKHTNILRDLVRDAATRHPASIPAMYRCFDLFRQVYPLPVWEEARLRAVSA